MSEEVEPLKECDDKKERRVPCGCIAIIISITFFIIVILLCVFQFRIFDKPIVVEEFESATDSGWLVLGDAQGESELPTLRTSGGNPGGYMEALDDAVGGVWYWAAPESFRKAVSDRWNSGDGRSRAALTFDLKQSALDSPFEDKDIIFSDGTTNLSFNHGVHPGLNWTSFKVPLAVSAGWLNQDSGEPASEAEMERVLKNLTELLIRGEFRNGEDTGGIDNIVIR